MDRRSFLNRSLALGGAWLVFHDLLDGGSGALAGPGRGTPGNGVRPERVLGRARNTARPLLVLLAPPERKADPSDGRGFTFGHWLLDPAAVRSGDFTEVDAVCARHGGWLAEHVAPVPEATWACFVEWIDGRWSVQPFVPPAAWSSPPRGNPTAEVPARPVSPGLPSRPVSQWREWAAEEAEQREAHAPRVGVLREFLRQRLEHDAEGRARRVFDALPADAQTELRELVRTGSTDLPPRPLRRRAAPWLFHHQEEPRVVAAWRRRLGEEEASRMRTRPPTGSEWARTSACGDYLESGPQLGTAHPCGTGFVAAPGRTFLWFYTR